MARLTQYHVNLLNHFKPASMDDGLWYDYVTRLSRKDARVIFKKQQHESLQVVRKPVRPSILKAMQEEIRQGNSVRRRKGRAKYTKSPQADSKDRRTTIPFKIDK